MLLVAIAAMGAGTGPLVPGSGRDQSGKAPSVSEQVRAEEDQSFSDDASGAASIAARRDPFRALVGDAPPAAADVKPSPSCDFGWREAVLGGIGRFGGDRIAIFHGPESRTCFLREGQSLGEATIRRIDRERREVVLRVPAQDPKVLTAWRDFTVRLYPSEEAGNGD